MMRTWHVAIPAILFLLVSQVLIFIYPAEPWFDVSFSLETAHKLSVESIEWSEYDVHPPLYYALLFAWENVNPGLSQYVWARELSVLFGVAFFIMAALFAKKFLGDEGVWAVTVLALCSTYVHFGVEVRSYMLLMLLGSIVTYALLVEWLDGVWGVVAIACATVLPWIHYFGVLAWVVPCALAVAYWRKERRKREDIHHVQRLFVVVCVGVASLIMVFLTIALPQRLRSVGTWYAEPTLFDWFGSQAFSFFLVDNILGLRGIAAIFVYFTFLLICVAVFVVAYRWVVRGIDDVGFKLLLLGSVILVPLGYLAFTPLLGDGFSRLYHHRLFVSVMWLYALAVLTAVARKGKKYIVITGVLVVGMLALYGATQHTELQTVMEHTPCESIDIVHESAFSAVPYQYWARERGCAWRNFVSTNFTKEKMNAGGGDVLQQPILFNKTTLDREYWYVNATGSVPVPEGFVAESVYEDDGVGLWHIVRNNVQ